MTKFVIAGIAWLSLAFLGLHFAVPEATETHNPGYERIHPHD